MISFLVTLGQVVEITVIVANKETYLPKGLGWRPKDLTLGTNWEMETKQEVDFSNIIRVQVCASLLHFALVGNSTNNTWNLCLQ